MQQDDLDLSQPALLQLRRIRNFREWTFQRYPAETPSIPLFYTPELGLAHPWTRPLALLEWATHANPLQLLVCWLPFLTGLAVLHGPLRLDLLLCGAACWSGTEYAVHRWLFHNSWLTQMCPEIPFTVHLVHHKQPHDLTRLQIPLIVSIPVAVFLWCVGVWWVGPSLTASWAFGFALAYLVYDMLHYVTHAWVARWPLQFHHLSHHYLHDRKFGFTSTVWDRVWGTD